MTLTVLSVAYPFAPVGPDTAGGAEQVLLALDAALAAAGHRSIVVAQEGSRIAGELVGVPAATGELTAEARRAARERHLAAIEATLASRDVDLVHFHGIDFADYLPAAGPPMLATLHLPAAWYPPAVFGPETGLGRAGPLWLNPVSHAQARTCPPCGRVLEPIENGVPVEALQAVRPPVGEHAVVLARICPEKGIVEAIEAAKQADCDLIIAGEVFAYREHQLYFAQEVRPRLDARRRFVGPLGFARKRALLASARCVLVPSLAEETSSLTAREAIACGAPVVAFARGALPETVTHGVTGLLADDVAGLAAAIRAVHGLDREVCRRVARERFSLGAMTDRYLALHARLASRPGALEGVA